MLDKRFLDPSLGLRKSFYNGVVYWIFGTESLLSIKDFGLGVCGMGSTLRRRRWSTELILNAVLVRTTKTLYKEDGRHGKEGRQKQSLLSSPMFLLCSQGILSCS